MSNLKTRNKKEDFFLQKVNIWTSFYRENPEIFVKDYLGIYLYPFQKILFHLAFHNKFFMYLASRGQGKSFLIALIAVVRCMLYPKTKVVIAAGTVEQAKLIVSEKIRDFYNDSIALQLEIGNEKLNINDGANSCLVKFVNGSTIKSVPSTEGARGFRANVLILEEFRLIKKNIITSVLKHFKNVRRIPKFYSKPEYKNYPKEPNLELYISSAWYKSHWTYTKFISFMKEMVRGSGFFVCGLGYKLAVASGLLTEEDIEIEKRADDFDPVSWLMEMECIFFGENKNSYFKLRDFEKNRILKYPMRPRSVSEILSNKKQLHKKRDGEIRIIGVDIALMGGEKVEGLIDSKNSKNDNSVFTFLSLIPKGRYYERRVVYIYSIHGERGDIQAKYLKRLFYELDCNYIAMDTMGNGVGVYDNLVKKTYDEELDDTYPPWTIRHLEGLSYKQNMAIRAEPGAIPVIFSFKSSGTSGSLLNHQMAAKLKNTLENQQIQFLVHESDAINILEKDKIGSYIDLEPEEQAEILYPYVQTSLTQNEAIKLDNQGDGILNFKRITGQKKDRYSALAMANYATYLLEGELMEEEYDESDELIYT